MSQSVLSAGLALHPLLLGATSKKSSSSGATTLIFLVLILAAGYFLLIRPQRQRARRQQQTQQDIGVGDEVMLTSGIIGTVTGFEGDRATVEISDGVEIEVLRRAIAQRVTVPDAPVVETDAEEVGPDPAGSGEDEYDHASDEPHTATAGYGGIPHGLPVDDGAADGDDSAAPGDEPGGEAAAGGTAGGAVTGSTSGGEATEDVPRVPGGGLGGPTQPDGRAGKE